MNKTFKKLGKLPIIVAVVAMTFLSIGCNSGQPKSGPVTIKIWKPFVDSDKMQSIMSAYQAMHPNVTIEYTKKNIENYEGDLLYALAAGNGPDIYSINNTWVPRYLDNIVPAPDKTFTVKDYKEAFVDATVNDLI